MVLRAGNLSNRVNLYPQWVTGLGVTIILIEIGIMCSWSSPYAARLSSPDSPLQLTPDQMAWVASLLDVGRFFGAIVGAVFINFIGTKKTLQLSILPIIIGWILIAIANSYIWLYISRILGGLATGMVYSCFALYVGEVALPEIRGALVSLAMSGGNSFGGVVGSVGGTYLSMEISSYIYLVLCIAVSILFLYLPDSSHWLVKNHDYESAKRSIAWYQPGRDADKELEAIKSLVNSAGFGNFHDNIQKFKSAPIRKALCLIMVLFAFMQITGMNSIIFYMETIIRRSNFTLVDPSVAAICINVFGIISSAISMCLIDKCGRRFLLILSCAGVILSAAALGANSYLISIGEDVSNLQWLPVTSVMIFTIADYIGLMGVPSTVLSEIIPADLKSVAGCVASLFGAFWSFATTRSFQPMIDAIGEAYVFWIYGAFALILIPYVIFIMPETKGKSLQQIQDELTTKS